MKAAIYLGRGEVEVRDLPDPVCGDNDVVIKNIYSGICGTDVAVYTHGANTRHPGQLGARAVAETLFGKNNPCGKLPITAVRHAGQIPIYAEQYNGSGALNKGQTNNKIIQGYVDKSGLPLWSFGYGLSYTNFKINNVRVSQKKLNTNGIVKVSCDVTNTGNISGAEIVQLYFSDLLASAVRPNKELADFVRVELKAGETKGVELLFKAEQSAFYDYKLKHCLEQGKIELLLGNSSDNLVNIGIVEII